MNLLMVAFNSIRIFDNEASTLVYLVVISFPLAFLACVLFGRLVTKCTRLPEPGDRRAFFASAIAALLAIPIWFLLCITVVASQVAEAQFAMSPFVAPPFIACVLLLAYRLTNRAMKGNRI